MFNFLSLSQSTVYTVKTLEKEYQKKADAVIDKCPKGFSWKEIRDEYSIKYRIYYTDLPTAFYITVQGKILYMDEEQMQFTSIDQMIKHLTGIGQTNFVSCSPELASI